jgi:hypothetical protein
MEKGGIQHSFQISSWMTERREGPFANMESPAVEPELKSKIFY